jgi:Flagellar hook-length control protein FliK
MNIGSLVPVCVPAAYMAAAPTFDVGPSFETLMPETPGTKNTAGMQLALLPIATATISDDSKHPAMAVALPSRIATTATLNAAPTDGTWQHSEARPAMTEQRDKVATPPVRGQSSPSSFEQAAMRNVPHSARPIIAQHIGSVSGAKTLPTKACEEVETPEDDAVETSPLAETYPHYPLQTETAVAGLPSLFTPLVETELTQTRGSGELEIADIVDVQPRIISTEKSAIPIVPFQTILEFVQPATTAQPIATAEPVATGHLDLARDSLWLDQLAREIVAVASSEGRLKFSLSPATLGNLDVAISTQSDGVTIQLQPSTETAARIIAAEQPKLTEELRQSGIRLINNDLLSGQQMGNARDHSSPQHTDRHIAHRQPAQPTFPTTLNPAPTQPQRGRFA